METTLPHGLGHLLAPACGLAPSIVGMVLYGSAARGTATSASDIDILVVLSSDTPIRRALYRMVDGIAGIDPKVAVALAHLPSRESLPGGLWLEIARDGKILFDRDGVVSATISRLKDHISSGRSVRMESHGQGYWVHHAK